MEFSLEQLIGGWVNAQRVNVDGAIASGAWGSTYLIESVGLGLFAQTMTKAQDSSSLDKLEADDELSAVLTMLKRQISRCSAQPLKVVLDG